MAVVIWTVEFASDLDNLLAYLEEQGAATAIKNILKRIREKSDQIAKYPESGQDSQKVENVRSVKIGKHHRMYYQIFDDTLALVAFIDLRRDPAKNPF
ncbi:MAG: type II toxin-antitoxin system RelE/ParE family toxin [Saprospiraceae bacterium]